jgi:hypothetical protein
LARAIHHVQEISTDDIPTLETPREIEERELAAKHAREDRVRSDRQDALDAAAAKVADTQQNLDQITLLGDAESGGLAIDFMRGEGEFFNWDPESSEGTAGIGDELGAKIWGSAEAFKEAQKFPLASLQHLRILLADDAELNEVGKRGKNAGANNSGVAEMGTEQRQWILNNVPLQSNYRAGYKGD